MKPHVLIPLLVVCVGLPLVAIGTYWVCDSFPVAEGMRKREVQYKEDIRREAERIKEERRLARERAEEERRQRELAEKRAEEEKRRKEEEERRREKEQAEEERRLAEERAKEEKRLAAQRKAEAQKSAKVTIRGISINLPREQLKQELAKTFGGISETDKSRVFFSSKAFRDFDYRGNLLFIKTTEITFHEPTAFGGRVRFYPDCDCVQVCFTTDINNARKYEAALQDQYGDPSEDNIRIDDERSIEMFNKKYRIKTWSANDGLIVYVEQYDYDNSNATRFKYDPSWFEVYYFNETVRNACIRTSNENERQSNLKKQQKAEQDAERERKRRARDAAGI